MANPVQKRMEAMTVEFEEMIRTGIFSNDECRVVMKKRKEFENKVCGYSKSLKDINEYIAYELCMYRLTKARRNKLRNGEKKNNLEHRILIRIKGLYEMALQRYPSDKEIYLNYFKFCRESHYIHAASNICENMVKYHASEDIWLIAARWHLHDANDISLAMKYLKRGLAIHKASKVLYSECVYYEVKNVKCLTGTKEEPEEKHNILNVILKKYLEKMVIHIKDCQHYIDLLVWLESYDFTLPAQNHIVKYLIEHHWNSENMWDLLAHREKKGIHYNDSHEVDTKIKTKLQCCIKRYEDGLKIIPSENRMALWNFYIKCLVNIKNEDFINSRMKKQDTLLSVFKRASDASCLTEEGYISWLELVNDDEARKVLKIATENYPQSVVLWKLRLRYEIVLDCRSDILSIFEKGTEALKEESSCLWILILRYHILSSTDKEIEDFYKEAVKQHPNIAQLFKPKYIEWLGLKHGIEMCREEYISLAQKTPYCKDLHLSMSQLESACAVYDTIAWERVHILASEQFREDIDVWLSFIDFHLYYKKSPQIEIVKLFEKAMIALPKHSFMVFEDKYKSKISKFKLMVDNNNV